MITVFYGTHTHTEGDLVVLAQLARFPSFAAAAARYGFSSFIRFDPFRGCCWFSFSCRASAINTQLIPFWLLLNTQNLQLVVKGNRHPIGLRRRPLQIIDFSCGIVGQNGIFHGSFGHGTQVPNQSL
jgi:hypothetical protein